MGKKLEGIVGLATFGSTVFAGLAYGVTEAKGGGMPGKEYVIPLLLLSSFCSGAKPSSPIDKIDPQVGGVYAGVTAAVWGVSFGLGSLVERLTS